MASSPVTAREFVELHTDPLSTLEREINVWFFFKFFRVKTGKTRASVPFGSKVRNK